MVGKAATLNDIPDHYFNLIIFEIFTAVGALPQICDLDNPADSYVRGIFYFLAQRDLGRQIGIVISGRRYAKIS
jgi:hypothetical protein